MHNCRSSFSDDVERSLIPWLHLQISLLPRIIRYVRLPYLVALHATRCLQSRGGLHQSGTRPGSRGTYWSVLQIDCISKAGAGRQRANAWFSLDKVLGGLHWWQIMSEGRVTPGIRAILPISSLIQVTHRMAPDPVGEEMPHSKHV